MTCWKSLEVNIIGKSAIPSLRHRHKPHHTAITVSLFTRSLPSPPYAPTASTSDCTEGKRCHRGSHVPAPRNDQPTNQPATSHTTESHTHTCLYLWSCNRMDPATGSEGSEASERDERFCTGSDWAEPVWLEFNETYPYTPSATNRHPLLIIWDLERQKGREGWPLIILNSHNRINKTT